MLVGSFYKNPDFYIEVGKLIVSKYDYSDDATRFLYDAFEVMYKVFSQTFNEVNINAWMSQDKERLKKYKLYGGYVTIKTWMDLAIEEDFKNYFTLVKKYSLLREYVRQGYPAERVMEFDNWDELTAKDLYRLIRAKADRIFTVIDGEEESVVLNEGMTETIESLLFQPDMGLSYPFPILNELFKGMSQQTMVALGKMSNHGKSRLLTYISSFVALVLKEPVFILMNEMTTDAIRNCLLTTVLNNECFQELHGVKISKPERELTLGLYRNKDGEFVTRKVDEDGFFCETEEEFKERLELESKEYLQVMKVAEWLENEKKGRMFFKELTRYDDQTLEFEIKKAVLIHNTKFVFYDTLKNDDQAIGRWEKLKLTTTKLKQLINGLRVFSYNSIQLTDDSNFVEPLNLNSVNIAEARHLKHVLDGLILCREISKETYHKYSIIVEQDEEWGGEVTRDLDYNKNYSCWVVDKNRKGSKAALIIEFDLNLNVWKEVGLLVKKK